LFPALWVRSIEVFGIAIRNSRATSAETKKLTLAAFLETLVLTKLLHLFAVINFKHLFIYSTDVTIEATACHQPSLSRNSEMTVAAITSIIDGVVIKTFRYLKQSLLVKEECPKVIL
jgi:hypothetical protein